MIDWDRWYDTLGGLTHFPMELTNSGGLRKKLVPRKLVGLIRKNP
jgi:hypothetical protein